MCRDLSELSTYSFVDNVAFRLIKNNTPGNYTFILKGTKEVPRRLLQEKRKTIGLRVPSNPIALALLEALGEPMLSTSLMLPGSEFTESDPEEIKDIEERALVFLRDVFGSMDLGEVQITSKYNTTDGCLEVDFEGEDMGILIGKRGQTLDSLQYLTSLVVNKGKSDYIRVKLDTEDYRRRRKETLENLARGIAYKVKKTRKPVVLEPMNPYERRIIHSALQGNKFVETVSEGEEPYRHVVVKLKRY